MGKTMNCRFSRLSCGILDISNLRDALSCIEEELASMRDSKVVTVRPGKKPKKNKEQIEVAPS